MLRTVKIHKSNVDVVLAPKKPPKPLDSLFRCDNCNVQMHKHPIIDEFLSMLEKFMEKHPTVSYEMCGDKCSMFHIAIWDTEQSCQTKKEPK